MAKIKEVKESKEGNNPEEGSEPSRGWTSYEEIVEKIKSDYISQQETREKLVNKKQTIVQELLSLGLSEESANFLVYRH